SKSTLTGSGLIRQTENPFVFLHGSTWLLSVVYTHAYYAFLLVMPTSSSIEYSYDCIPAVSSFIDYRNLGSIATYTVIAMACIHALRTRSLVGLLALIWMLIPFVPASHLFTTIGTLVAERLMYIPSIG